MSKCAWGKPRLFTKDIDTTNSNWSELSTPVEDTTELTTTKGDKLEAKIEGGQAEDVKYKASSYALAYQLRKLKERNAPFAATDGVVANHYAVILMPEDPTCYGFYIADTAVTVDDTYTAGEGAIWAVQHDAVAPATGNTVLWGTVTVDSGKITFTEKGNSTAIVSQETIGTAASST